MYLTLLFHSGRCLHFIRFTYVSCLCFLCIFLCLCSMLLCTLLSVRAAIGLDISALIMPFHIVFICISESWTASINERIFHTDSISPNAELSLYTFHECNRGWLHPWNSFDPRTHKGILKSTIRTIVLGRLKWYSHCVRRRAARV